MIYSASRRTDLPAFYPDYLVGKIRRSRKLDGVVYWTKDIRNFTKHFGLEATILSYPSIIQYTVTGLAGSVWEAGVPHYTLQGAALKSLVKILPRRAIRWRFDPIIVDESLFLRFKEVSHFFRSSGVDLDGVTVSFVDMYKQVKERVGQTGISQPTLDHDQKVGILRKLYEISGLSIRLCCEADLLGLPFVTQSHCIDSELFAELYGLEVDSRSDTGQRVECGCSKSTDIGSYDQQCNHDCLYCYACPDSR